MDILEQGFPEFADRIRQRRINDAELEEICRDYELLMNDLLEAELREGQTGNTFKTDLRNSLAGLHAEILAKLGAP